MSRNYHHRNTSSSNNNQESSNLVTGNEPPRPTILAYQSGELQCNACWSKISDKAIKTRCDHCFCGVCEASIKVLLRDLVCPCCSTNLRGISSGDGHAPGNSSADDGMIEFQVVGGPILDSQLGDLKSMMLAVILANGEAFFTSFLHSFHVFEKTQLEVIAAREGENRRKDKETHDAREQEWSQERLGLQHELDKVAIQCEQGEKDLQDVAKERDGLREALEERTRQADNWKAMYEALKNGGSVSSIVSNANLTPVDLASSMDAVASTSGRRFQSSMGNPSMMPMGPGSSSSFFRPGRSNLSGYSSDISGSVSGGSRLMFTPATNDSGSSDKYRHQLQQQQQQSFPSMPPISSKYSRGSSGYVSASAADETPRKRASVQSFQPASSSNNPSFSPFDTNSNHKRSRTGLNVSTIPLTYSPQAHQLRHSRIFAKLSQDLERNMDQSNFAGKRFSSGYRSSPGTGR